MIGTGVTQRDTSDDEIVLAVLDVVERDTHITQRHLASELGIALGLANTYLKRCIRKGFIKVSQVPPRRYAYYLTPQGFSEKSRLTATYLLNSFSFFRRARQQCGEIFTDAIAKGHRRLAFVGTGDLAEIASLVAREHPISIVGVVPGSIEVEEIAKAIAALGPVDAVVITALESSREVYAASVSALSSEQVHAPALLRVHPQSSVDIGAANANA